MTDYFKRTLASIGIVVVLLAGGYFWLAHRIHDIVVPPQITLPSNDKAVITYDENRHRIGQTTATGTIWQYSRNPNVEIRKDGTVKVNTHTWGTELRPFLGVGYSDTGRAYTGCYLFYFRQFDVGASFGWTADNRRPAFQPMLSISYNVWSNTSINVGINPLTATGLSKPEPAIFLSVRI